MNDEGMTVTARELEVALNAILEEMRSRHGSTFTLPKDYFWDIASEQLYDPYKTPSDMTLGQVSESIDWVKQIASGAGDPTSYALVWLSDVLRALGHSLT